ncbi:hypothetical protein [Corallococcus sicarius]|nr:hypothetical protein [Corallococcus sicarius]
MATTTKLPLPARSILVAARALAMVVAGRQVRGSRECEFLKRLHESLAADGNLQLADECPAAVLRYFFGIRGILDLNSFWFPNFCRNLLILGEAL